MRDVMVLLPGITGSVLRDSRGRDVWALTVAKQGRDAIRDNPGDPTWLACTLYGDPAATVSTAARPGG